MSQNRTINDRCEINSWVRSNKGIFNYMLFRNKYENARKCRVERGALGKTGVSLTSGLLVDVESNLFGITEDYGNVNLVNERSCNIVDYKKRVKTPYLPKYSSCSYN